MSIIQIDASVSSQNQGTLCGSGQKHSMRQCNQGACYMSNVVILQDWMQIGLSAANYLNSYNAGRSAHAS